MSVSINGDNGLTFNDGSSQAYLKWLEEGNVPEPAEE